MIAMFFPVLEIQFFFLKLCSVSIDNRQTGDKNTLLWAVAKYTVYKYTVYKYSGEIQWINTVEKFSGEIQ